MTFKRIFKIIGRIATGFIAFVASYLLFAYILSHISVAKETSSSPADVPIYILTNGVHTDVVLPVKNKAADWSNDIKYQNTTAKDTTARYIAFGWGDKGFYLNTPTWSQLKFSVAFKAAFALSSSAIHATFYKQLQEGPDCKKLFISQEQYSRLVAFVRSSFKIDSSGQFINIKTNANYGVNDAFYEAKGKYNLFYTCNTWANNALKSCGQKACLWTPFDKGIFYQYRNND
jgi:uncharacterized protein (TIGR02117 family)